MADPIPPADHVDDAFARAQAEVAALKKTKPKSAAEARVRAVELSRLQQDLIEASKRVVDANAAKRIANGNGAQPSGGQADVFSEEVLRALAKGMVDWLGPILKDVETRLAAIEKHKGLAPLAAHIAGIEQRMLSYEGVWREGKSYSRGSFVTHAGSLWFAEDGSIDVRPGAGSSAWKLAVKKGHAER